MLHFGLMIPNALYKSAKNGVFSIWYLFSFTVQHDTTVADMMSALRVYDGIQPPYASAFFIELLSDDTG